MLVLSGKAEEHIVITLEDGREIDIRILSVGHNRVRLGFVAPPEVSVDREVVAERKRQERRENTE